MDRKLPTLSDVARCAGVSYATADRVVNDRGGVAAKSVSRVQDAVAELGYIRNVAAANLSQRRVYRFVFVIPTGTNAFFERLRNILAEAQSEFLTERIDVRVVGVAAFDPGSLADCLRGLAAEEIDGVAVVGSDSPEVNAAITDLRDRGIGVLTLVTAITEQTENSYIGIDNIVTGRTVGRLLVLAHGGKAGRILPILGSMSARDHAERLRGMSDTAMASGAGLDIAPCIEGFDRHDIVEAKLRAVLEDDHDITAIYSAGAGNSGLIRVLGNLDHARPRPVVILHELVPHARRALEDGLIDIVIDQRPEEEIARALAQLRHIADRKVPALTEPIVPAIYVKENLPVVPTQANTGSQDND